MESPMDPGDLLLLDAIIREGSITGASLKLREPKATISRRLQKLEKSIGSPLFDRTSGRLRLTPLGESLAGPAAAIRIAMAGAKSVADGARQGDAGQLRIASPSLFGRLVLAPFVGDFMRRHENLSVTLKYTNEVVDPLREGFDFAIQIPEPKVAYLISSKLASADLMLYAAPAVAQRITGIEDLRTCKAIKTSNDVTEELTLRLSEGDREWDEVLPVACTVNDPEAACYIAARSSAIAALPSFLAQRFVANGELAPVLPHIRAGSVRIFVTSPPGRLSVPLVRAFMTELKRELATQQFGK